jgi:hypothetical protein
LWLQIARKKLLSAIDHQGNTLNINIAKVQAQNVVFRLLDDIELVNQFFIMVFVRIFATHLFSN